MTPTEPVEIVGDAGDLPNFAFGTKGLVWWGTLGFMLLEGAGFFLAGGVYLYLAAQSPAWPPAGDALPGLVPGSLFTLLSLASLIPNLWLERQAIAQRESRVRWGLVAMTAIGALLLVVRVFEFTQLGVRWDHDAYGAAVWMLLILHTTHVITDLADTAVITTWMFTHQPGGSQFVDVRDNGGYWTYVVVTWLPLYALIYWGARWL
jgi:heme/copper-type cytochrome/quinol oxidase subunit 3